MKLEYIKSFNDYNPYMLNESLGDNGQKAINRAFMNMNDIPLSNGDKIRPKDIVKVVSEAINWIAEEFRTYYTFARDCNIIYIVNNPNCTTMAVDEYMNMYMDALFIYKSLKMDPQLVAAVIMHEIFHVVYNHIERGKNWLSANGLPIDKKHFKDTNLAADIEVNSTLVNKGIIDKTALINEIHGLYLSKKNGERTNLPMEEILENEKLMNKLREMVEGVKDTREHVQTSEDWDKGYKTGWDKIADILDKYGPEETIKKLKNAGIIDEDGKLVGNDIDDIIKLNFITIKSFSQFILESKNENMFQSYDDGFKSGVQKAIGMIMDSLNDDGEQSQESSPNMQNGNNQPVPNSNLTKDDLKKLNLPKNEKKNKGKQGGLGDNLPTNTNDENQDGGGSAPQAQEPDDMKQDGNNSKSSSENGDESSDGEQQKQSGSNSNQQNGESSENQSGESGSESNQQSDSKQSGKGGGNGKSTEDSDVNKLADDLKGKSKSKGVGDKNTQYADKPNSKGEDNGVIGNTGSFIDDPNSSFAKDVLKNSGYSDEDIQNIINDTIEKNKRLNTPEGIKEKRNKLYSKLSSSDPVKKLLDEIEVNESKYKNIWKKIMKQFLSRNCRHAGKDVRSKNFDWKNKRALSLGRLAPNFHKEEQEPQNINMYIDVSGSVNVELLEVIAKSISIFCNQYEYTSINIIPWASTSNGVHAVESVKSSSPEKVAKQILGYISEGIDECGGGTDLIRAFLPEIVSISNNKSRTKKDDKHIIITDGETGGDEKQIESLISKNCGSIVNKNCFWMIYDPYGGVKESWEKSINTGTLLFINSQVVIGNK